MRAAGVGLALALAGCTLIAPFGDLTSVQGDAGDGVDAGEVDAGDGVDAGEPMACGDAGSFVFDAGPMVDPMGVEVCNRLDDDTDGRYDENVLRTNVAELVPGISGVGERIEAAPSTRGDTYLALFESADPATLGRLRAAEVQVGGAAREATLSDGLVGDFDVALTARGYAVVWVEDATVRFGLIDPTCGIAPTSVQDLAELEATRVRVAANATGTEVYVVWIEMSGQLSGTRVDLRGATPDRGPIGDAMGMARDVALTVAGGQAYVATIQGPVMPPHAVTLRGLNPMGMFGPPAMMNTAFEGDGPFDGVNLTSDPESFLILTYHTVAGSIWASEVQAPALFTRGRRRFGGMGRVFDSANDASPSSGTVMDLEGQFAVARIGANPDGELSTDEVGMVPFLSARGWRAIVGYSAGPFRYVVVGRDASGGLKHQTVTCR